MYLLWQPKCIKLVQHKNRVEEAEKPGPSDGCLKGRAEPVAQPATSNAGRSVLFGGDGYDAR